MAAMQDLLIIEVAEGVAGPTCGLQCADLGARVVKVEPLWGDRTREWGPQLSEGASAAFEHLNAGKESVVLDLAEPSGRLQLDGLLGHADAVVVQVDLAERDAIGLDWRAVAACHPHLVVCEIGDFGVAGEMAGWAGSELVVQAMSGITSHVGEPGGAPCRVGYEVAGMAAAMHAFQAVAAGLLHRSLGNGGQYVRVDALASLLSMQTILLAVQSGGIEAWAGFHLNGPHWPADTAWDTSDGQVTLDFRPGMREAWVAFCQAIGRPDLPDDRDYADWRSTMGIGDRRFVHGRAYGERFAVMTSDAVTSLVNGLGGISVKFHDYAEMLDHPQVRHLDPLIEVPDAPEGARRQFGMRFRFAGEAPPVRRRAPRLGEHTASILAGFAGGVRA